MPGYYPTQAEILPSQEELDAQKRAAQAQQDPAWGQGIGSIAGGLLGLAPLLVPGGAAALPLTVPLGAQIGGSIGGAIGTNVESGEQSKDAALINADELARNRKVANVRLRQAALDSLESA